MNLLPCGTLCLGARNVEAVEAFDGTVKKTKPSESVGKFRRFGGWGNAGLSFGLGLLSQDRVPGDGTPHEVDDVVGGGKESNGFSAEHSSVDNRM
jgi:hypothetical protein